MPIYEFKCKTCNKKQEVIASFSDYNDKKFGNCKKCGKALLLTDQLVNFEGAITGITPVTQVQRKYSNKKGGPKPIIDGKIRNDLKMPTQS